MKSTVAVHLADGFEEIEAVSIIDVLRRADLEVLIVSVSSKLEVTGAHHLKVIADVLFEEVNFDEIDMIVLPGGMPGSNNLDKHAGLKVQILEFNSNNKPLAAICAAPLVFGNLGILEGKQAVCYPGFEDYLKGADVLSIPVVDSGNIITGRGVGTALEFALKIVEKMVSADVAKLLTTQLLVK